MMEVIKGMILGSIVYLTYINFVEGSKVEKLVFQAADVGKQTVVMGKEGLDQVNNKVLEVVK